MNICYNFLFPKTTDQEQVILTSNWTGFHITRSYRFFDSLNRDSPAFYDFPTLDLLCDNVTAHLYYYAETFYKKPLNIEFTCCRRIPQPIAKSTINQLRAPTAQNLATRNTRRESSSIRVTSALATALQLP